MTDRTTKALLLAIALGLWVQIAQDWFAPVTLHAQDSYLMERIAADVRAIASGICINARLC